MKKFLLCLCALLLNNYDSIASEVVDETIKVMVGTQTYQCEIANQSLSCKPVNSVQQKEMNIKKNGGRIQITDAPRGLSVEITTSLDNTQVNYNASLCSNTVCTVTDNNGGVNGYINQTMFGQYNITEKSFFVLGFFINSQIKPVNLEEKIKSQFSSYHLK